eukprot:TRINITY_DN18285_c0_g1_i1.p1 TRINITY_DN18285_c0_g1~~TRINITY_DN18285_c0_g1_i1.p1  ORF type:complete len:496 (-),score=95.48 TRINITY_DN18285_c0_g1_i1:162-1649(-)
MRSFVRCTAKRGVSRRGYNVNCNIRSFSTQKSTPLASSFKVEYSDEEMKNPKTKPFIVQTKTGFLPRTDPILNIPPKYNALDNLLNRMRWHQPDESEGLLAKGTFGKTVENELKEYKFDEIEDTMMLMALYRDYSFLASAYLLEPCHHEYLKTNGESYGLGRKVLPRNIAVPFNDLAERLNMRPFMEYNTCYSLNNWVRLDPRQGVTINNIDFGRSFMNMRSEAGFILVHVAINQHSGNLVKAGIDVLKSAESDDREQFNKSLQEMRDTMVFMNQEFERMYIESNPSDYNVFRTFIMGIKNQPMFPDGVVYEGCFNGEPQHFRGESGANDSVIPFCDNILQITKFMPSNPLTEILRDFRSYRPEEQQAFLEWSEKTANQIGTLEYAKKDGSSMVYFLEVADQVRAFRHRHWVLTNLYIIYKSKHPIATGGSPISTWLPNQLLTVNDFIINHAKSINLDNVASELKYGHTAVMRRAEADSRIIRRDVERRRKQYNQ